MTINFKCPKCRKAFKLADKLAGRQGKCPDCGSRFKIPAGRASVTQEMPPMPNNPFGALDYDDGGGGEAYQPRRRRGGWFSQMFGCVFLLAFVVVAAVGGAYAAVYFNLIKRDVAEPYLAKIPFKVPGLTTTASEEATAPESTAKAAGTETTAKGDATDPKKDDTAQAVPLEYRFLPDKAALLVSVNVEGLVASKLYQKLKSVLLPGVPEPDKIIDEGAKGSMGVPLSGISRIIVGARTKDDTIVVLRTKQPITADEIKKNIKDEFTEVKIGKYVMYDGKKEHFCVVDERTLLIGETGDALKKVLERDKPPEMISDLQTVFKQVTATKTISLAVGPQELRLELDKLSPAIAGFKPPKELQPLFDSQAFALQVELSAGVEVSASLQCKNKDEAEALKKAFGENVVRGYFEEVAKANAGKPPEQWAKDAVQAFGKMQLAVSGDTLNANLAVTDDVGANLILLGAFLAAPAPAKKPE